MKITFPPSTDLQAQVPVSIKTLPVEGNALLYRLSMPSGLKTLLDIYRPDEQLGTVEGVGVARICPVMMIPGGTLYWVHNGILIYVQGARVAPPTNKRPSPHVEGEEYTWDMGQGPWGL